VKRLAARASLQAVNTNHILTPQQLFEWAQTNISGIKFFFVPKSDVQDMTSQQEKRFSDAKKMSGTRSHHCFILAGEQLQMFRISSDTAGTLMDCNLTSSEETDPDQSYMPGQYVAAVYDQAWYAGNIVERNDKDRDVLVNFLRSAGSPGTFQWPRRKDECWVPLDHILCILPAPSTTSSGRQYSFDIETVNNIEKQFKCFAEKRF